VSKDHGVASFEFDGFVVAGVHDEALSGSTGHDGARSLGHGSGELHDLSVPGLVRDVSLSVLGNSLLSGGSPGSESSDVSHVLVVHGHGLELATGLAFLVGKNLSTSGVSGSAPELNNLSLGGESLGVSLLVSEFVKEFLGALAHLRVEHVSLHGGRESDVADKLGVKSGSLSSSNNDSVSSEFGELSLFGSSDGVSDVEAGSGGSLGADSVVLANNSAGSSSGNVTSEGVSSADSESLGVLNSHSSEGVLGFSHEVMLGSDSSAGNSLVAVDGVSGVSEVLSSEDGVSGEHFSLEDNLTFVFLFGDEDSEVSSAGSN